MKREELIQLKQGFDALQAGDHQLAWAQATALIKDNPRSVDVQALAGLSAAGLGQYAVALEHLQKVLQAKPGDLAIRFNLARAQASLGQWESALNSLQGVNQPAFMRLRAESLERIGRYHQAADEFKALYEQSDVNLEMLGRAAWNLEKSNQLDAAQQCAQILKAKKPDDFYAGLVLGRIHAREKRFSDSLNDLQQIGAAGLNPTALAMLENTRAEALEGLHQYTEAFAAYTRSNRLLMQSDGYKKLKNNSFYAWPVLQELRTHFDKNGLYFDGDTEAAHPPVVFMVGFPRSGTTLLEKILSAHGGIATIEEKPCVDPILQHFLAREDCLERLNTIDQDTIQALQSAYLRLRDAQLQTQAAVVIDKLPLNIIHIGLLLRVFPHAKIIVSVREPRDVLLSCYFQLFELNDAMANFLDWNQAARYLNASMILGLDSLQSLKHPHHQVRYENLVQDLRGEVAAVLKYLELPWDEVAMNYREKLKGQDINTPSYRQVGKQVHSHSVARWKNYTDQVHKVDSILAPVRERLGYV